MVILNKCQAEFVVLVKPIISIRGARNVQTHILLTISVLVLLLQSEFSHQKENTHVFVVDNIFECWAAGCALLPVATVINKGCTITART